jgi:multiple sugar transport system substrate-binding protein
MTFYDGYKGPISSAAAAATAEYILVQMFASVCAGQAKPEDAAKEADRRLNRIYRKV